MFDAITSNFHWSEPATLATLHDKPWSAIRIAMTARKQGMRQVRIFNNNLKNQQCLSSQYKDCAIVTQ